MDEKKPSTSTNTTPPPPTQPSLAPIASAPIKPPLLSRRRFLQGAVAASVVLAAAEAAELPWRQKRCHSAEEERRSQTFSRVRDLGDPDPKLQAHFARVGGGQCFARREYRKDAHRVMRASSVGPLRNRFCGLRFAGAQKNLSARTELEHFAAAAVRLARDSTRARATP